MAMFEDHDETRTRYPVGKGTPDKYSFSSFPDSVVAPIAAWQQQLEAIDKAYVRMHEDVFERCEPTLRERLAIESFEVQADMFLNESEEVTPELLADLARLEEEELGAKLDE